GSGPTLATRSRKEGPTTYSTADHGAKVSRSYPSGCGTNRLCTRGAVSVSWASRAVNPGSVTHSGRTAVTAAGCPSPSTPGWAGRSDRRGPVRGAGGRLGQQGPGRPRAGTVVGGRQR